MSVITTTINITDRGPSLQGGHTIHVFVSSTPGQHRPSGREIGHISPTVGNKSHCCRNISLPRQERCLQFNNTAASSDACHQPPPLSAQNTSPLSIFLGDTRDKINKTRCKFNTQENTHCRRLSCCQWLWDRIWSSQQFYARRTSCVDRIIRKPGPLPLHSGAVKQADQPCNMLGVDSR